jgi:hypothetical protein
LYCEQLQLRLGKMWWPGARTALLTTQIPCRNAKTIVQLYIATLLLSQRKHEAGIGAEGHTRVTALPATFAARTHNKSCVVVAEN